MVDYNDLRDKNCYKLTIKEILKNKTVDLLINTIKRILETYNCNDKLIPMKLAYILEHYWERDSIGPSQTDFCQTEKFSKFPEAKKKFSQKGG